jgi:epoxyqueuosine reductase
MTELAPSGAEASVNARIAAALARHGLEGAAAPLEHARFEVREKWVRAWVRDGLHGRMDWLAKTLDPRTRPWEAWPWAKSFVVVKLPYDLPAPLPRGSRPEVAGYARQRDYHYRMDGKLKALEADLAREFEEMRSFRFCDDQHLPEIELALAAGLGWRGKHTLLLDRRGSAFHLGGLLLSLEGVEAPRPHPDHCGTCTACLDACPTGAFLEPGRIDAGRCLSHWNIEDRETSENQAAAAVRGEIFGCDLCQQACPWNRKAMTENVTAPRWPSTWEEWVTLCRPGGGFQSLFTKTPLRRSGRHKTLKVVLRALWNVDPDRARTLADGCLETETHVPLREWIQERLGASVDSRETPQ